MGLADVAIVVLVLRRTQNGSYRVVELDRTVSNLPLLFSLPFSSLPHPFTSINPSDAPRRDNLARFCAGQGVIRVDLDYIC